MKRLNILYISLLITLPFILFSNCNNSTSNKGDGNSSKVNIYYKNGVKHIVNPNQPIYGESKFKRSEPLYITVDKVDGIIADDKGAIYILDVSNSQILKFDNKGNLLFKMGSRGEGPDQFMDLYDFFFSPDKAFQVLDYMNIKTFDTNYKLDKQLKLPVYFDKVFTNAAGNICGIARIYKNTRERVRSVVVIDRNHNIKTLDEFPYPPVGIIHTPDGDVSNYVGHYYVPSIFACQIDSNFFLYAYSQRYVINIVNADGSISSVIEKNEPETFISSSEKEWVTEEALSRKHNVSDSIVRKSIFFPDRKPFFNKIIVDDKGWIYVQRLSTFQEREKKFLFDVFNREGIFIYRLTLDFSPEFIKNGYMYYYREQEENFLIVRERLKL